MITFVTYNQFINDIRSFAMKLPRDYDAIVGIERSGLIPASVIALELNIPILPLNSLLHHVDDYVDSKVSMRNIKKILVVDDSTSSGRAMKKVHDLLDESGYIVDYACVYGVSNTSMDTINYVYKNIDLPRVFEWNLFHHDILQNALLDIDGVLFVEPPIEDRTNEYIEYITNPQPLHIPSKKVLGLVTGRLEKYRPQTEASLKSFGIEYDFLEMAQYDTPQDRRRHNMGEYKGEIYKNNKSAELFIESSPRQAFSIAEIAKKTVICIQGLCES